MTNKIIIHTIFTIGIILLSTLIITAQPCPNRVEGVVLDSEDKAPLIGVTVLLENNHQQTTTDSEGRFVLTGMCESVWHITLSYIGYDVAHEEIEVAKDAHLTVQILLKPSNRQLPEVEIHHLHQSKKSQHTTLLSGKEIRNYQGLQLSKMLEQVPGVSTLQTGNNVSKPIINGLHSQRILILQNDVRQEGQQWGQDHSPEIDPFTADKIEVLKSAATVRYGAGAIGGVILIQENEFPVEKKLGGYVHSTFQSNGNVSANSAQIEGAFDEYKHWNWRVQGTYKIGGNQHTPDYSLANTGIREDNISASLGYDIPHFKSSVHFNRFASKVGILKAAHVGNIDDLKRAIEATQPLVIEPFTYNIGRPQQQVEHYNLSTKMEWFPDNDWTYSLLFGRQYNNRKEFDATRLGKPISDPTTVSDLLFEITTYNVELIAEKHHKTIPFEVGIQGMTQYNTVDRGGLIPNFRSWEAGIFGKAEGIAGKSKWHWEAGIRLDVKLLDIQNRGKIQIDTSRTFAVLSGTAALSKQWATQKLRVYSASAWRPPTVNELYSEGVHHGTASYESGNAQLGSEISWNNGVEYTYQHEKTRFQVAAYTNYFPNFINLRYSNTSILTVRGVFPKFDYFQQTALMYGFDAAFSFPISSYFNGKIGGSLLRAKNLKTDKWINFMPSDRVRATFNYPLPEYKFLQQSSLSVSGLYVFKNYRINREYELTDAPEGYFRLDLEAQTTISIKDKLLLLNFGVNNLTNTRYREYMNRFRYFADEIGRNIIFRAKFIF